MDQHSRTLCCPISPAINSGDPSFTPPPVYDQRGPGFDRVINGSIDGGSFEIQSAPTPTATPTPTPTVTATPTPKPSPLPTAINTHTYSNGNSYSYSYAKTFAHTEASAHTGASPMT